MKSFEYGLIGQDLRHSFSAEIHPFFADYNYQLKELAKEDLAGFMQKREFKGINVTMPYKEAVTAYLDQIGPLAKSIGAVNTIVNRRGKLIGYNTDILGMKALIKRHQVSLAEKKVLILGSGATSKTAIAVAKNLKSKDIIVLSRNAHSSLASPLKELRFKEKTYEEALKSESDANIIINATPCGMFPNFIGQSLISLENFPHLNGVFDAVYNPLRTPLILDAKKKKIPADGGLYMLIMQAFYAAEIFTEQYLNDSLAEEAYTEIRSSKENIVLIGMPSSGKSSVGNALSALSGWRFIDTDHLIVEQEKQSIQKIISEQGEEKFRKVESELIKTLLTKTKTIIATGGGSILDPNNVDSLKANGKLYFLDRPLQKLTPTSSRPLTSDFSKLEKLFTKRYPIYLNVADLKIDIKDKPDKIAKLIWQKHKTSFI